ncbi:MAG TPA: c-type cytochrome [Burkholderiales bacterium]|nr:c-type cytochrome [Burkholderiales bacterium]
MLRFASTRLAGLLAPLLATIALTLGLAVFAVHPAAAAGGHKMNENDMELPIDDAKVVEFGREKFAQRCSFCHGGGGKGGKGPCLTCGKFPYSGNTNTAIYTTIATGVTNRSMGGTMGAFGTTMSAEEITAVMTYMRAEERRRIAAGEIPNPYEEK